MLSWCLKLLSVHVEKIFGNSKITVDESSSSLQKGTSTRLFID